jgi:tRNA A-37 threonylcarbamoyl transferase component Bud32
MLPTRLGKYEVIEEIARGAYGIVVRARDAELGREVAIKILREEETDDDAVVARFIREAQVLARLSHPHIVRVFEAGEKNGLPYFVMELIEGLPLTAILYASSLDVRTAAVLFEKIARAVHFANERGVIHRDLKPGNVLVRDDGEPVVMDFGIARDERRRTALTRAGELLGTPQYMSPEQIGGKPVDARTDVYALGAVLYEYLVKRAPFDASGFAELSMKILNDEPPSPILLNPLMEQAFEPICMKCLRKKPEERYRNAGEMADDLARVAAQKPVLLVEKPKRRTIAWLGVVGALCAGALAAAAPESPMRRLVESDPPGASVDVEGAFAGVTPLLVQADWVTLRAAGRPEAHARPGWIAIPSAVPEGMVVVGGLFVDAREVSQRQYAAFVEATGARAPWKSLAKSRLDDPVTGVTWEEAVEFAAWADKRLPTVAEWSEIASCPALGLAGGVQEWAGDERAEFHALCGGSDAMAARSPALVIWRTGQSRLPDAGFRCVRTRS